MAACSVLLLVASLAQAQGAVDGGFQPNRDYLALQPWESIDTATGNVILTFTDLVLPRNAGRDLTFQRVFNNSVMGTPVSRWTFSVSGIPLRISQPDIPPDVEIPNSISSERSWAPSFRAPDGSLQQMTFMQTPSSEVARQWTSTPNFWKYHRGGRTLFIPDGRAALYDFDGRVSYVYDQFGNTLTFEYVPGQMTVVQGLGSGQTREVVVALDGETDVPTELSYGGATWYFDQDAPGRIWRAAAGPGRPVLALHARCSGKHGEDSKRDNATRRRRHLCV